LVEDVRIVSQSTDRVYLPAFAANHLTQRTESVETKNSGVSARVFRLNGGGARIRTLEGVSQQIYRLLKWRFFHLILDDGCKLGAKTIAFWGFRVL